MIAAALLAVIGTIAASKPPPPPSFGPLVYIRAPVGTVTTVIGVTQTVAWDAATFNSGWTYSPGTSFTVPSGITKLIVTINLTSTAPGSTNSISTLTLRKNATDFLRRTTQITKVGQTLSTLMSVSPGDVIDARIVISSTALTMDTAASFISIEGYA